MALVTAQMSVSLDGFISGPQDVDAGFHRVTRWVIDAWAWRDRLGFAGGERNTSSALIDVYVEATGAYVMGRRMFDGGEVPWGDVPPFRAPVFVVTHRPRETLVKEGGTSFTFVADGIHRAIELARDAAGGKNVAISGGGTLVQQVIRAGLLDQLDLHIAPVLIGKGMRLFGPLDHEAIELTPIRIVDTPEVTHIRYKVSGPASLTLDDRGTGRPPRGQGGAG
ncbi:MAG TPA: dihydrofolate reductase family protein [Chloroflexota bacterium]|nr:dihydrofolate reductase family protein [Chloroflexota bacterium]